MNINGYFELYLKNYIKYDRNEHIKNMGLDKINTTDQINEKLINDIFMYIDAVLFNRTLHKYIKKNVFKFVIESSKKKNIFGMFFVKDKAKIGFKFDFAFFRLLINKKIINIDLGVLDNNGKSYYSKLPIEPLLVTIEHEIIHMLVFMTRNHSFSDFGTVKSGHTPIFKKLAKNIFNHNRVTSLFNVGDINENMAQKNNISVGDYIKIKDKNISGYVVGMKSNYLILCVLNNINKCTYESTLYKNTEKLNNKPNMINIKDILDKLLPNKKIILNDKLFIIDKVNKNSILAYEIIDKSKKNLWKISKLRILEIKFID